MKIAWKGNDILVKIHVKFSNKFSIQKHYYLNLQCVLVAFIGLKRKNSVTISLFYIKKTINYFPIELLAKDIRIIQ